MRILLKLVLDCTPDAAWRAIRSPRVFRDVSFPFTSFTSLEPGGFPDLWPAGAHPVLVRAFGIVSVGEQVIEISFPKRTDDVHIVRDTGHGEGGPLSLITRWDHRMAVSPGPDGTTLYRDQLVFGAGAFTLLLWPVYWAFWQWRARQLVRLAPQWR